jgi:hypothetical protein
VTPADVAFPAVAFHRDVGRYAEPGLEKLTWFYDEQHLSTCTSWDLKYGQRNGMVLVDSNLRSWTITKAVDRGIVGGVFEKIFRWLVQQSEHRVDQELAEGEAVQLEALKSRIYASIRTNPDFWWDEEAIAGEAGPPREEAELMEELLARVRAASCVPEILDALEADE